MERVWNFACPDWEKRIRAGASLVPNLPLFEEEAAEAVSFFDQLQLPDVPGAPFLRDAVGDWFRDIIAALFGSRDPVTNERHIREVFGLVGKGNAKTTYSAALMLVALLMNTRPRAEYLLIGPTQAIADLAYSQAAGMIELNADLRRRFRPREHIKEILDLDTKAKLKVKTFDLNILTGPRPVGVLLDELHLLGRNPNASKVLRQLRGGLEKSTEGFLLIITTQSDEQPAGAFKDELTTARSIRDGRFQGRMLPILYEFPDAIARDPYQWSDPANWPMVMPNLGRSLRLNSLIEDWEQERRKGAHAIQVWASQHLNIEIGIGLRTDRWSGADDWAGAAENSLTFRALLARSEVVCAGIDGGGKDDLLGLAIIGRERGTRRWLLWTHAWAHRGVLELRKEIAPMLEQLARAGDLHFVDDMEDAYGTLADVLAEVDEEGLLHQVGIDLEDSGLLVDALADRGIEGDERVKGISQGYKLNGAIKAAGVKVSNRSLVHCGQPLMDWSVGNVKVEVKGNAYVFTKQVSGTAKIDPVMAMLDAVTLMSRNPRAPRRLATALHARGGLL